MRLIVNSKNCRFLRILIPTLKILAVVASALPAFIGFGIWLGVNAYRTGHAFHFFPPKSEVASHAMERLLDQAKVTTPSVEKKN